MTALEDLDLINNLSTHCMSVSVLRIFLTIPTILKQSLVDRYYCPFMA